MVKAKREGDKVTLEMTFEEYRDLTESLTAAGNQSWRHKDCQPVSDLVSKIRASYANAAWEWSNGIGIPPLNDGETKTLELEPFKFLSGPANVREKGSK